MTVSVQEKPGEDNSANLTYSLIYIHQDRSTKETKKFTWVAIYVVNAGVTWVIPCICAFPECMALGSFSMELGEVKICLYASKFVSIMA